MCIYHITKRLPPSHVVIVVVPEASYRRTRHREEQQCDQDKQAHGVTQELLVEVNAIEDAAEAVQGDGIHLRKVLERSQGLEDKVGPLDAATCVCLYVSRPPFCSP